jgi:hypothetical protein
LNVSQAIGTAVATADLLVNMLVSEPDPNNKTLYVS